MMTRVEQDFAALVRTDNAYKHHGSAYNAETTEVEFLNTTSKLTQLQSLADRTMSHRMSSASRGTL